MGKTTRGRRGHRNITRAVVGAVVGGAALVASLAVAPPAGAIPGFSKAFDVETMNPGDTATLTFTITGTAETNIDFDDTLPTTPGAMVVATPPNVSNTCTNGTPGTVTAVAGTGTISYDDAAIVTGSCTVSVDITATALGTYTNTSDAITATSGTGGTASDTLVVAELPSFSKAFSPETIDANGISTLTFTIDNTANNTARNNVAFSDTLPTTPDAMVVASTPNDSTTCGGTWNPTAGSGSVSFSGGTVNASSSCTVSVDVTAPTAGTYDNTSDALTSDAGDSGTASASLVVTPLVVTKTFVEGSIVSGGTATFNISIRNDGTEDVINVVADDPLATGCNRTFSTIAASATETYSCTQANVTANFTNTLTVTATTDPSGVAVSAVATAAVTVTAPTTTTTTPVAGPALALTGSSTGPLTAVGLGALLLGALLVLGASQRRKLRRA